MTIRRRVRRLEASHSYGYVLALVVLVIGLTIGAPDTELGRIVIVTVQAATLLVAVWTARAPTRTVHVVSILAGFALLFALIATFAPGDARALTRIVNGLLVAVVPVVITRGIGRVIREQGVTLNAASGVLTLYLLLGLFFGTLYAALAELLSTPYFIGPQSDSLSISVYFSFVTQTTVGYGDVVPALAFGRALAVVQAVLGQLYLVSVVGLVVGHIGRRGPLRGESGSPGGGPSG